MSYPYRFYGRWPADVPAEHLYRTTVSVAFGRAPSGRERRQLGEAWMPTATTGSLETRAARRWRWSGRIAIFEAVGTWPGSARSVLRSVADGVSDLHAIVPIVDVVNHGGPGVGRWDRWSSAQGSPTPGPKVTHVGSDPRPIDSASPPPASDDAFAEGFGAALDARVPHSASRGSSLSLKEASKATPVRPVFGALTGYPDPRARGLDPAVWTDELRRSLRAVEGSTFPVPRTRVPLGWWYERVGRRNRVGLVRWRDGEWSPLAFTTSSLRVGCIRPSSDGRHVLTCDGRHAWEVDLESGAASAWYTAPDTGKPVRDCAYLPDDRRVVLSPGEGLLVFDVAADPDAGRPRISLASRARVRKKSCQSLGVACGGSVLICSDYGSNPVVWAYLYGNLHRLAAFDGLARYIGETAEGDVILEGEETRWVLAGLPAELERLRAEGKPPVPPSGVTSDVGEPVRSKAAEPPTKSSPPKRRRGSKPRLALVRASYPDVFPPRFPAPDATVAAQFPDPEQVWVTASGRVVGRARGNRLYFRQGDEVHELAELVVTDETWARAWTVTPDGRCLLAVLGREIHGVDCETREAFVVAQAQSRDHAKKFGLIESVVAVGPADVVIRYAKGVAWLSRSGPDDPWTLVGERKVSGATQVVAPADPDGSWAVVRASGKYRLHALVPDRDKRKIATRGKSEELVDWCRVLPDRGDGEPGIVAGNRANEQAWWVELS